MVKAGEAIIELRGKDVSLSEALNKADQDMSRWAQFAKQTFDSTRTPAEQYKAQIEALQLGLEKGVVSQDTYNRAVEKAKSAYNDAIGATKHMNDETARGAQVFEQTRTPLELYRTRLSELKTLLVSGAVDQESYSRAVKQAKSALDQTNPALQKRNTSMQRGQQVTQALLTPEERHIQNMIELQSLLKMGAINQDTYNRGIKQSETNTEAMAAQAAAGKHGVNTFGIAIQQASFGVQDFAQVYGQTGLSGALRASANNWSQVLAIIGPFTGAIGGMAITIGSVLIADMLKGKKATDEFTDAIKELDSAIEAVGRRIEVGFDIDDLIEEADAAATEKDLKKLERESMKAAAERAEAEKALKAFQEGIATEEAGGIAGFAEDVARSFIDPENRGEKSRQESGKVFRGPGGEIRGVVVGELSEEEKKTNKELQDKLDKLREQEERVSEEMRALVDALGDVRKADKDRVSREESEKAQKEGVKQFGDLLKEFDKEREDRKKAADKLSSVTDDIDAELNPAGARVGKILQELEDRIAAGADPTTAGRAAGLKLDALLPKERQDKARFGFAGISQLGEQIQDALLSDPSKKAQEETAKNTKEMVANGKKQLAALQSIPKNEVGP